MQFKKVGTGYCVTSTEGMVFFDKNGWVEAACKAGTFDWKTTNPAMFGELIGKYDLQRWVAEW